MLEEQLNQLYEGYGYRKFRMSKFEDYDLYAQNKDFLKKGHIITFTDVDGSLKALKPDITLSIIKNNSGDSEKVYYNENVYREMGGTFKEILQVGVDSVGQIDPYAEAEVIALAAKSLNLLSEDYVLDLSDVSFIRCLLGGMNLSQGDQEQALTLIAQKNAPGIQAMADRGILSAQDAQAIQELMGIYAPLKEGIAQAGRLARDNRLHAGGLRTQRPHPPGLLPGEQHGLLQRGHFPGLSAQYPLPGPVRRAVRQPAPENGQAGGGHRLRPVHGPLGAVLLPGAAVRRRSAPHLRAGRGPGQAGRLCGADPRQGLYGPVRAGDRPQRPRAVPDKGPLLRRPQAGGGVPMIQVALPKGRLGEKAYETLAAAGYECPSILEKNRKLTFENPEKGVRYFWVKPSDVSIYVERGAADVGIAGKDILLEYRPDVYELLDLKMGKCRMCVAGPENFYDDPNKTLRVATKFPHIAGDYYESRSRDIDIIKLNGSIELAPILGLSDVIVDIVETGNTLRENHLAPLETIVDISARFICNKVSYKFKYQEILAMRDALAKNL